MSEQQPHPGYWWVRRREPTWSPEGYYNEVTVAQVVQEDGLTHALLVGTDRMCGVKEFEFLTPLNPPTEED